MIVVTVARVSDSCGYAVPNLTYVQDRNMLDVFNAKKGDDGSAEHRGQKNSFSLDDLPGHDDPSPCATRDLWPQVRRSTTAPAAMIRVAPMR